MLGHLKLAAVRARGEGLVLEEAGEEAEARRRLEGRDPGVAHDNRQPSHARAGSAGTSGHN